MDLSFAPITIIFKAKGDLTGTEYSGTFEIKPILDSMEKMAADQDRRSLLGNPKNDEQVNNESANLALALSQIRARITKGADFYNDTDGLRNNFIDNSVVFELFTKAVEVETTWRAELKKQAEAAKEALTKQVK